MAENSTVVVAKTDGALPRVDPIEMFNAIQDDLERFWRDPEDVPEIVELRAIQG